MLYSGVDTVAYRSTQVLVLLWMEMFVHAMVGDVEHDRRSFGTMKLGVILCSVVLQCERD